MELHNQALSEKIPFEIIVFDDASDNSQTISQNREINTLPFCNYKLLSKNVGRSAIRNLLAQTAQYEWLLFLDADTMPVARDFIEKYLPRLNNNKEVIYGGICYQPQRPDENQLLRWIYGKEREALSVEQRNEHPHLSLLTLNFAIRKSVFEKVKFNESIPNLRYEDTLFSFDLMKAGIKVEHIDNKVYHLGLETSEIFIRKSEEATLGLKYLIDHNLIDSNYIKIARVYHRLKKLGVTSIVAAFHSITKNRFRKNLLSAKPSLFIFDLYRLGYLCSLKND